MKALEEKASKIFQDKLNVNKCLRKNCSKEFDIQIKHLQEISKENLKIATRIMNKEISGKLGTKLIHENKKKILSDPNTKKLNLCQILHCKDLTQKLLLKTLELLTNIYENKTHPVHIFSKKYMKTFSKKENITLAIVTKFNTDLGQLKETYYIL